MKRNLIYLKHKYNTLLLPTFCMVMSDKLAVVIDMIIIGFFIGSQQLSIINLTSPLTYFTGIFYILFGQGGNLLALRAQSKLDHEKMNYYFTLSILGIGVFSILYVLFIFLFADNILIMYNCPAEIFNISKEYLLIIMFYYPLNCYIIVVSYFIRSDGFPRLPFYAVLIANILNIFFDILFLKVFNGDITSTALSTVIGYLIGAIYISQYIIFKKGSFQITPIAKNKMKKIIFTMKEFILNTPEVIGKIFFTFKISLLTYLCSTYLGVAGLLAFLIYDNSESVVYIFLSGIMKAMSPIVTVLHKENDYEAIRYMIIVSMKQVLLISIPVSILFFIYPEILLSIFNVVNPHDAEVVTLAIRITSFSLIGRCISYLLASYTQAIERNKISSIITFFEEFLFIVSASLILTRIIGGKGIWIAILIAESLPVVIYVYLTLRLQKSKKDKFNRLFLIQKSKLITWTYNRNDVGKIDKYLNKETREHLIHIEDLFKENAITISNSINDICNSIFEHLDIDDIDLTIRLEDEKLYIVFTNEGKFYNPLSNNKLKQSNNIKALSKLNCQFDYDQILGFNKTYIIYEK